jgi:hypothetical protein
MRSPEINTESVRIQEGGDLQKGFYFYALTGIDEHGNESYPHVIQVYARYEGNTIGLSWKVDPEVVEYRLYRGKSLDKLEGFFAIFTNPEEHVFDFYDSGIGVLNEFCTLRL